MTRQQLISLISLMAIFLWAVTGCSTIQKHEYSGANCNVTSPPEDSGEQASHGTLVEIYPRKSTMDKYYSGCQTIWLIDRDGKVGGFVIAMFEAGELVKIKYQDESGSGECVVEKGGRTSGDTEFCAVWKDQLPYSSYPPGCFNPGKRSQDCEDEPD